MLTAVGISAGPYDTSESVNNKVLTKKGGYGVVRVFIETILQRKKSWIGWHPKNY